MKVAFISGTSIVRSNLFDDWESETIRTDYGSAVVRRRANLVVINRHGFGTPLPPHAINHRENIAALRALGIEEAVSLNSVGSMREGLPPGTLVSCDDYVSMVPATFSDETLNSIAPEIGNHLVPELAAESPVPVKTGMVYVQMRGPRFETKAEIRVIRSWGDVVGMTMASEADLCQEAGIGYNSFCMVDNFAHGMTDHILSDAEFHRLVASNQETIRAFVTYLIERLEE